MEWKEVRLGDIADVQTGPFGSQLHKSDYIAEGIPCIMPTNIGPHLNLVVDGIAHVSEVDANRLSRHLTEFGDIIYARRGDIEKCAYVTTNEEKWLCGTGCLKIRCKNEVNSRFIAYLLSTAECKKWITGNAVGTTMLNLSKGILSNLPLIIPSLVDQRRIASILSSLDRKIELNNKINADLEEMAQAIFKNWFVDFEPFKDGKFVDSELGMIPEGWKVGTLTEIASYMNGLAMQKYPPENTEDSLPVLKIKELGQGFCGTDSDRCSCNIKDECKIHNGDVIFSWSGTLLVDVWCGGDCGLNQHLFKVTSNDYPKWFYYYWTKHHLQEFIHIAKDKAVTMGHIKRGHLEEALVAIPDNDSMEKAHELFEPILSKMISLRLENSRLSLLRDTLLPRLMSGELEVPE